MLSQAKLKLIRSLDHKKARRESGLFVAEGPKVVGDLLEVMSPRLVVATEEWLEGQSTRNNALQGRASWPSATEVIEVSEQELKKASFLQHPQQVLALFPIQAPPLNPLSKGDVDSADNNNVLKHSTPSPLEKGLRSEALSLALDGVQDPGNLGTIIRLADWFGVDAVYCSRETADVYSPKVVQATMGSLARVQPAYVDLEALIASLPDDYPVYGTFLDGKNIYEQELSAYGLIVMGNEGNGISAPIRRLINRRLFIPNYPQDRATTDSLNVAIATAITCAEFRRRRQPCKL